MTSRNEKNQNAFRISSNAKSNEFQSKDKSRRISLHLVQGERRHDLIFESEAPHSFVPFRSEGNERKTNSLRPDRYTYIPLPSLPPRGEIIATC